MLPNSYNIFLFFSNAKLLYFTPLTYTWLLSFASSKGKTIQSDPEKKAIFFLCLRFCEPLPLLF